MNITHENIIRLILDPKSRSNLFKAIASENNTSPDIKNAVSDAIYDSQAIDESEMVQIKNILLKTDILQELSVVKEIIPILKSSWRLNM